MHFVAMNSFFLKLVCRCTWTFSRRLSSVDSHLQIQENKLIAAVDKLTHQDLSFEAAVHSKDHILEIANKYLTVGKGIRDLQSLEPDCGDDAEMKTMILNEMASLERQRIETALALLRCFINDVEQPQFESVYVELNAAVGGQEAMLFTEELYNMYAKYCAFNQWSLEVLQYDNATETSGGCKKASLVVKGHGAYDVFKFEAGVHRVQRVPVTDQRGRMHTSTMSLAALPQPREIDVQINPSDLKMETMRSSGAGGQHVNKTDSAVRLTHIPTRTIVDCQVHRSQIANREEAIEKLRRIIFEESYSKNLANTQAMRRLQIGTKDRSEKIRTYNYQQKRVTDHRLKESFDNISEILAGGEALHQIVQRLQNFHESELISEYCDKILTDSLMIQSR